MIQLREKERDIAGSVGHAGGGEGDEEGVLPRGGGREGREGGENVLGCGMISGTVGGTPMPEIMMSAVRPLRVKVPFQSSALKTSPLEMVRWA